MMKKHTSQLQAAFKQALIVPAIVGLLMISCAESSEEKETIHPTKSKSKVVTDSDNTIYNAAGLSTQPEYPGGMQAFYMAVNKSFQIPEIDHDMTAKIYVSFVVEKDGSISEIKVLRDPGYGLGAEAKRVLESDKTKWTPGIQNGKVVRTSFNLPITINIKN